MPLRALHSIWSLIRDIKKKCYEQQEREKVKCGFPHSSQANFLRGPSVYGIVSDFRECPGNLK